MSQQDDSYPKWTVWDALKWYLFPNKRGGGMKYLNAFKDSWIIYNKDRIFSAASSAKIPPLLLAGVAWNEVGGMPDFADSFALPVRSFDWSAQTGWIST